MTKLNMTSTAVHDEGGCATNARTNREGQRKKTTRGHAEVGFFCRAPQSATDWVSKLMKCQGCQLLWRYQMSNFNL